MPRCCPPSISAVELTAAVQLSIAPYDNTRAKDVWATVGGAIKPSFELIATTAGDALPFLDLPPAVRAGGSAGGAAAATRTG